MFEIERKFLITRPVREIVREQARANTWMPCENIQQVYLPKSGKWNIRCRQSMVGEFAMPRTAQHTLRRYSLTMKRKKSKLTSIEIEHDACQRTYDEMAAVCGHEPINKNRWSYYQPEPDGTVSEFLIDEFLNPRLEAMVLVEIELTREDQEFTRPDWLGEEVTGRKGYSNASLVERLR